MSAWETVQLWRNALLTLADPQKSARHSTATFVLQAVWEEWERRECELDPDEDGFPWPSTRADGGSGNLKATNWLQEGLLKSVGYTVGDTAGLDDVVRQHLLAALFDGPIPPVFPRDYMQKWSRPRTPARLRQLAETLAAFARNAKRRNQDLSKAIGDWEADHDFLFHTYYRGRFGFDWPRTIV